MRRLEDVRNVLKTDYLLPSALKLWSLEVHSQESKAVGQNPCSSDAISVV